MSTETVRENYGMECPSCHKDDEIIIAATEFVRLYPDGTESTDQGYEWDVDAYCSCEACGWNGIVGDAIIERDGEVNRT